MGFPGIALLSARYAACPNAAGSFRGFVSRMLVRKGAIMKCQWK